MLRFFKVEDRTLKQHISIGVFVVYIDTESPVHNIPSKSRDLAEENNKVLTEWKLFETTVLYVCCIILFWQYTNSNLFKVMSGFIFSNDQSAMSLLFETEYMSRAIV